MASIFQSFANASSTSANWTTVSTTNTMSCGTTFVPTNGTITYTITSDACNPWAIMAAQWPPENKYLRQGSSPVIGPNGEKFVINWSVQEGEKGLFPKTGKTDPNQKYSLEDLAEAWYDGAACRVEADYREKFCIKNGHSYLMPDGSVLSLDDHGNYTIADKMATVTYRANRFRDFSPHINASDMLAQFVEYVATLGIDRSDVLGLPIELFINWLVISAAERDQDPVPAEIVPVQKHQAIANTLRPTCLLCKRYIPREYHRNRFDFCNAEHGIEYVKRNAPKLNAIGA